MKKALSILLAILVMASVFTCAFSIFAEEEPTTVSHEYKCTCANHRDSVDCTCCIYCPTTAKRMACVTPHLDDDTLPAEYCCGNCTGFLGCTCAEDPNLCDCKNCNIASQSGQDPYSTNIQIIPADAQKQIIKTFRSVLEILAGVFDKLFKAIEDFLRIDEFFANLNG